MTDTRADWRPASHCPNAHYTLRWDEPTMTWILNRQHAGRAHPIGTIYGFPIDRPPVDARAALAWADHMLNGPQEWINRPRPSSAFHTHARPGDCPEVS